ncbi:winged helix-turn-helix transcriptional regulator [Paenibacillus amylolyticus]|uniref:winged helix-turn-helix transcriptional regulator n=1 Tax=Paenibacillus TaxID=44249 RepID=UPI0027D7DA11|nr:winged helix-turn-helix transcriptional regulator [Paenibacillus sp. W4I10]
MEANGVISKKELPLCPVATTVGLIGNKWKLLVVRDLLKGTQRFGENFVKVSRRSVN